MTRVTLLSPERQREIKSIKDEKQFHQIACEVEDLELIKLIGLDLLQHLQNTPTEANNKKLLDGCSYVNALGNTVTHKGLRYILAYFNYSRYLETSYVTDTATGFVEKIRTDAENISDGKIKRLQENARSLALTAWEYTEEYIVLNALVYPLYYANRQKHIYAPKFNSVNRTNYGRNITGRNYSDPIHRIV
jgi:hypothetical protein